MQVRQDARAQQYADDAARLDRLPPTRAVWRLVLLISLGGFFEFYDLFFTGYVAPGMIASGLFKPESLGVFASLEVLIVAGFCVFVLPPSPGCGWERWRSARSPTASGGAPSSRDR